MCAIENIEVSTKNKAANQPLFDIQTTLIGVECQKTCK